MKLTPIKVRGKRGQPKRPKKTVINGEDTPEMDDQPQPKRSKKHHTKAATGIGGMLRKDISRLLQLPQEVLEHVFIASENLSLPLVNHELRRRLSTDSIKYQLVGAAFGPTWDAWYGIDNYELHSYFSWGVDVERIEGNPAFQSAILACSWAKFDLLLNAFDVWIRQHARRRAYFTVPRLHEERLEKAPEPGSLYEQAYNAIDPESSDRPRSPNMSMRQKLAFDLTTFRRFAGDAHTEVPMIWDASPMRCINSRVESLLATHLEVHPSTVIPDELLSGPFESESDASITVGEEKARRLFWLVRGGAGLQEGQSWEVTRDGFRAILQLVRGSTSDEIPEAHVERRLALAMQFFLLFTTLQVFYTQWPKYILETILSAVTALIPTMPRGSEQELQLGVFASSLRNQNCVAVPTLIIQKHQSGRWCTHGKSRDMLVNAPLPPNPPTGFRIVRERRAELFLLAPTALEPPTSSAASTSQQL